MVKKIGIIGCGAIGSELGQNILNGNISNSQLSFLFDIDVDKLNKFINNLDNKPAIFTDFGILIKSELFEESDLIIEAASINAAVSYCTSILKHKKDLMMMSIGAFANSEFLNNVLELIKSNLVNVYLPSGAIGGIDIIKSVKDYLYSITLITTKNNKSLKGAPFFSRNPVDIDKINVKKTIFEGNATEAIMEFPSNVNVAALVSLAGIGFKDTKVKIVVDPTTEVNMHEIKAIWKFGEFVIQIKNSPSKDNPKTSYLAVLSALECLRNICNKDIKIGS